MRLSMNCLLMLVATVFLVAGCQQGERTADAKDHQALAGRHVAILIGPGFHDGETLEPKAYLTERGAKVTVIGIEPGEIKAYNSDQMVKVERAVRDVSVNEFDALVIPGGRSPAALRQNEKVVAFARDFVQSGKPVAAICHGPQLLVTADVLRGRTSTCFPDVESEITMAGGKYVDMPVVRDGNLITSRVPKDIPVFNETLAAAIKDSSR